MNIKKFSSIIFLMIFTCTQSEELMSREEYSFFVSVSRFILFPIRYFIAPYFQLKVPTLDRLYDLDYIKKLREETKSIVCSAKSLSEGQGIQLAQEILSKSQEEQNIFASINMSSLVLAHHHDQLTFLEQVFTDRKKELHEHLFVISQKVYAMANA